MKICPHCMRSFENEALFCPLDGIALKETKDPYIGKTFIGQFEIRERCGQGSMGSVYRAWQLSMEREVAIKVLRRDLLRNHSIVKRFQREARASARLSHPGIITVYLVGAADDGAPFLAMEYLKGRSLDEICKEEGPLAPVRAIHVARQITSALAEAHGQHIIHRDLKPENIFLTNTKHTPDFVKVLDFGIAKILYENNESLLTQTGAIFGTPYYLAPEQAAGGDLDHRCDLYALGVLLFLMTTGSLPFQGSSGMAVLIKHLQEPPPRPRDLNKHIPRALERLILKSLEKAPENRFQSAEEMRRALEQVLPTLGDGQTQVLGLPGAERSVEEQPRPAPAARGVPDALEPDIRGPEPAASPRAAGAEQPSPVTTEATHSSADAEPTTDAAAARPQCDTIRGTGAPLAPIPGRPPATSATGVATLPVSPPLAETVKAPGSTQMLARRVLRRRGLFTHLLIGMMVIISGSAVGAALGWYNNETAPAPARAAGDQGAESTAARDSGSTPPSDATESAGDLKGADSAPVLGTPAAQGPGTSAAKDALRPAASKKKGSTGKQHKRGVRGRLGKGSTRLPDKQPNRKASWTIKDSKQRGAAADIQPAGPDPAISGSDHGDDHAETPDPETSPANKDAPGPAPTQVPGASSPPPRTSGTAPAPSKPSPAPVKKGAEDDSFYDLVD